MTIDLTRLVKPLVWGQEAKQPKHAVSIIGTYLLMKDYDGWRWMRVVGGNLADVCQSPFAAEAAAQVAANADYAARVLAAIDTDAIAAMVEKYSELLGMMDWVGTGSSATAEMEEAPFVAALAKLKGPQA